MISGADVLGKIDWGLPPPLNQHCASVRRHSMQWLAKVGLARGTSRMRSHAAIDIPLFAAMTVPWATRTDLMLMQDWLAWVFELDDLFDHSASGFRLDAVNRLKVAFSLILSGGHRVPGPDSEESICTGLRDLWRRIRLRSSPAWRSRFVQHVMEYVESFEWEEVNRRNHRCPDVEEYLRRRQQTGAAHPSLDLLIPTLGIPFDDLDWEDPLILRLEYIVSETITLSNDLISYRKEDECGDLHNLVLILIHGNGVDEQDAVMRIGETVAQHLKEFDIGASHLLERQGVHREHLARYLYGLRTVMSGHYLWSQRSARYANASQARM